jgi:hypothetical protein
MDEVVEQLSALAQEAELAEPIDWEALNINKEDLFRHMAANVYEQLNNVAENERAVVAMATMTKLLVENSVYKLRLRGVQ